MSVPQMKRGIQSWCVKAYAWQQGVASFHCYLAFPDERSYHELAREEGWADLARLIPSGSAKGIDFVLAGAGGSQRLTWQIVLFEGQTC
jgi:hypothetical protein